MVRIIKNFICQFNTVHFHALCPAFDEKGNPGYLLMYLCQLLFLPFPKNFAVPVRNRSQTTELYPQDLCELIQTRFQPAGIF